MKIIGMILLATCENDKVEKTVHKVEDSTENKTEELKKHYIF